MRCSEYQLNSDDLIIELKFQEENNFIVIIIIKMQHGT